MARPRLSLEAPAPLAALAPLCNTLFEVGSLLQAQCYYLLGPAARCTMQRNFTAFAAGLKATRFFLRSHRHSFTSLQLLSESHAIATIYLCSICPSTN